MTTQRGSSASGVRRLLILRMALAVMAILAVLKLGDEFGRLLAGQAAHGAGDLRLRRLEVLAWFSGAPVYPALVSAIYPPASYILFWPLTGWLSVTSTIWLWAMTSVVALVATQRLTIRDCRVTARAELWTLVLLLLSMNATGVVIGNGQVILHVLPLLLAAVLWVHTRPASWRRDVLSVVAGNLGRVGMSPSRCRPVDRPWRHGLVLALLDVSCAARVSLQGSGQLRRTASRHAVARRLADRASTPHSCLSAVMGSTDAARRAGR